MISASEVSVGLVLHLDPAELEARGATCTRLPQHRVKGGHFFLCVGVDGAGTTWLPLYTGPANNRERLDGSGKSGHEKWTSSDSWFYPNQTWRVPSLAALQAASVADRSRTASRNRFDAALIPTGLTMS